MTITDTNQRIAKSKKYAFESEHVGILIYVISHANTLQSQRTKCTNTNITQ